MHLLITTSITIYLVCMIVAWVLAGASAQKDAKQMRIDTAEFNRRAEGAGHLVPPQAPISVAYQNIFWQGIVWPAYFSALWSQKAER